MDRLGREGVGRVRMYSVVTLAYLLFWGPLFLTTLIHWDWTFQEAKQSMLHEVTLHVAFVHSFVSPVLLMVLHKSVRQVNNKSLK